MTAPGKAVADAAAEDVMNPPTGLPSPSDIPDIPEVHVSPDVATLAADLTGLRAMEAQAHRIVRAGIDQPRVTDALREVRALSRRVAALLSAVDDTLSTAGYGADTVIDGGTLTRLEIARRAVEKEVRP